MKRSLVPIPGKPAHWSHFEFQNLGSPVDRMVGRQCPVPGQLYRIVPVGISCALMAFLQPRSVRPDATSVFDSLFF
jgi:hypothetical protein